MNSTKLNENSGALDENDSNLDQSSDSLDDLLYLMARLRDPETGCPWDCEQDFNSIVPHTLEEAYEVADAIEQADYPALEEELGDLLFQVVFYTRLGEEQGLFDFHSVMERLVAKLVRRHPHVFPAGRLRDSVDSGTRLSSEAIHRNWELIKTRERAEKSAKQDQAGRGSVRVSRLARVVRTLPSLVRAQKLQKVAASAGFDWDEVEDVFGKLDEEVAEIRLLLDLPDPPDKQLLAGEVGDLLFACVNLARHLGVNADTALRMTNQKFCRRFEQMELALEAAGQTVEASSPATLNDLWEAAKAKESGSGTPD